MDVSHSEDEMDDDDNNNDNNETNESGIDIKDKKTEKLQGKQTDLFQMRHTKTNWAGSFFSFEFSVAFFVFFTR